MKRLHGWHVYLAITFILFGLLITMQIETQTRLSADLSNQSQSDLTVLVKNLTDKRLQLSQELEELGKKIGVIIKLQREDIFNSMQRI